MSQKASNVTAASPVTTGGILGAPRGTALPTTATAALNSAFVAYGYAGEKGLEPSGDGAKYKDIKAWGGDTVTVVLENKSITKFKFTLIEAFNPDVNKLVFGEGNVTVTAATTSAGTKLVVLDKGDEIPRKSYVFDMLYGGKKMRYVAPDSQLAVLSQMALVDTDITAYECEITCFPDATGVRTYRYLENDDVVPA